MKRSFGPSFGFDGAGWQMSSAALGKPAADFEETAEQLLAFTLILE